MIKVMHCISDTNFGGAGRVLLNYLSHFDDTRFEILVVVPKGSKLLEYMDPSKYKIIPFDGLYDRSFNRDDVKALTKLIADENPQIVHSHGALSARIAGKKCGKKVVYTRHSIFDLPAWQTSFFGKMILGGMNKRYADRIVAVSPAAKTLLVDTGTPTDLIDVVFNGVEQVERTSSEITEECRALYGVASNDFVCSIVARLEEVKGHRYLIDAAAILKERGITDIRILIAGTGGILNELTEYAEAKNVTDIVHFVGFIKEINKLLSVTGLQINASYGTEATSMALLEGFSLGIPAVVSDFGGNPFVVEDGVNGLVFQKKNAEQLADAILKVKNNPDLYQRLSQAALNIFHQKFTAAKMAQGMEDIYINLCGGTEK